ncbi:type II secretion system F family protein [Actibacterium sp. MT2.3-13A]|uniref:type II secretion system F family protein n=1 Tax=Actibacterium sp. MT2.3-13A TaxID=2828332 RepID=UPI001BA64CE4|nr:type II secretion system F family protein [Actibacterium sp. MT2.3-13A]
MELIFIYAGIFVAALLVADTLLRAALGSRRSAAEVNSRLRALKESGDQTTSYTEILKRRGLSSDWDRAFTQKWFARFYTQSGMQMTAARRFGYLVAFFLIGWGLTFSVLRVPLPFQIVLAAAFAAAMAILLVLYQRSKRIKRFTAQLPPAMDIIVRSLNAGHPLNAAIALVAKEMPDPIGTEFGILSDQLTFGADLETSMLNMFERVGAPELKLLAVTVTVQRGTGGNLSEILENLSGMIRARIMLKAKIRAISAEGRITAMVMAVFPFFLFAMIRALVPTYFDPLWESGYGTQVVVGCLVIMSFGIFVLYRLVNFDF